MGMAAVVEARKHVPIEQLLSWTYCDELPKGIGRDEKFATCFWESVSPMFRLAQLGTRVDLSIEPGFPPAMGAPHPDALMIDYAVQQLPAVGLDWRASRERLVPDLLHWVDENDPILSSMSFQPHALLVIHAKLGTRPIWDLGKPHVERKIGPNGKPVVQYIDEDSGEVRVGRTEGRHYGHLAHCPLVLSPPAREIACARAEYSVWWHALEHVRATVCAWNLHDHEALPPEAEPTPWIVNREPKRKRRVLPSIFQPRVID